MRLVIIKKVAVCCVDDVCISVSVCGVVLCHELMTLFS